MVIGGTQHYGIYTIVFDGLDYILSAEGDELGSFSTKAAALDAADQDWSER